MTSGTRVGTTNATINSRQQVTVEAKYSRSIDSSGWLKIKLEPSGKFAFICEYTKVLIQKNENKRVFFLITEGVYKNKIASLNEANAGKCLISYKRNPGASLSVRIIGRKKEYSVIRGDTRNQLFAELTFNGRKVKIILDSEVYFVESNINSPDYGKGKNSKPLPRGSYKIMIPDYAKDASMTSFYRDHDKGFKELKYDTVWFPIEYKATHNSNFIHVGHLSEGCVTCYDITKWNDLYQYLITRRTSDGKYVGDLTIS